MAPPMTSYLTKPIRAIHFLVLAFLMMFCSPVLAQSLGDVYYSKAFEARYGNDVPDYSNVIKFYRLSAEQGNTQAQTNLAVMYRYGDGVPKDYITAHMWFNIAAANGHERAGTFRDELTRQMSKAGNEKAKAMARECMSSSYTKCGY